MSLTVMEVDGGIVATTGTKAYTIDNLVIGGICRELVQGRDMEDGLAPIFVVAAIIEEALGVNQREFEMPTIPEENWLHVLVENDQLGEYGVDPLAAALGQLGIFGGHTDSWTL